MFLLVATALAGTTQLGWPCQRLNWGWRNVWSTCSINSFAPVTGAAVYNAPLQSPAFFHFATGTASPTHALTSGGVYAPGTSAAIPKFFCDNAAATGTGATANLRNRCRRAVDAYGSLVRQCALPAGLAGNRGPITGLSPVWADFAPASHHVPHVTNVQALTHNAAFCSLPPWVAAAPNALATPSTSCPGLLGWFTVVYNACGFTNSPSFAPATTNVVANLPQVHQFFPVGTTQATLGTDFTRFAPIAPAQGTRMGVLCGASINPETWNVAGATFRTSRCRRALDQFGRTASRCHFSTATATGPAQAGGFADPLRLLAVGNVATNAPQSPLGLNVLAPICN